MKFTDILILLCIALSVYVWNTGNDLSFSGYALFNGDFYTLLTAIFVHANPVHLLGNILFLYAFGHILEGEVGAFRMGMVFFTGGILTFIFSIPLYPGANMVGASAAIFAIMAAVLIVRQPDYSVQFLSPIGPLVIIFLVFNLFAVQNGSTGNIAYISHIIGFVIGLFFGAAWNKNWKKSLLYTLILLILYIVFYNYLMNIF